MNTKNIQTNKQTNMNKQTNKQTKKTNMIKSNNQTKTKQKTKQTKTKTNTNTNRVNFNAVCSLGKKVDFTKISSNDIYAILTTFGVEAARAAIVNEINNVFTVYGISVDQRHLGLIAGK